MGMDGQNKMRNEYEEIYGQYRDSGFKFNYSGRRISKSRMIFRSEMDSIDAGKHNRDMMFVNCGSCGSYMDFEQGLTNCLDGWWRCPVCGARVKESTAYHQLERENMEFANSIAFSEVDIPEICMECGGPWPDCETSCKLFEE